LIRSDWIGNVLSIELLQFLLQLDSPPGLAIAIHANEPKIRSE
jgi:hypothetical protein